jgi:transposase-like protein
VLIVRSDPDVVEKSLLAGELNCPACRAELRPWSSARRRPVRERGVETELRPRRARCTGCRKTHVLLPDSTLLRRRDSLGSICAALLAKAGGTGRRLIGRALSVSPDTVGGWLRRFASLAEQWRARCWAWAHALDPSLAAIDPSGSGFADALAAIGLAVAAATRRFGPRTGWGWVATLSGGRLLANTSYTSSAA